MSDEEKEIALMAARGLLDASVAAARTNTVLYVKNDTLMRKEPNGSPVVIRQLTGRNPELAGKFKPGRTYKIKKRNIGSE